MTDLHDGTPIFGALLKIEGTDLFVQTNENGTYSFGNLCPGEMVLFLAHPKCNPISKKYNLISNTDLNFELEHHINELEEIVISDNQLKGLNGSTKESRLNTDQIIE